jgi:hypothetical protein
MHPVKRIEYNQARMQDIGHLPQLIYLLLVTEVKTLFQVKLDFGVSQTLVL